VGLLLGLWTLLGVFFATQTYIGSAYGGRGMRWAQAFTVALGAWYVRGAFAPVAYWLGRRFPLLGPPRRPAVGARIAVEPHTPYPQRGAARPARRHYLFVHIAASLVLAVVQQFIFESILSHASWVPRYALSPVEVHMSVLAYWVVVGVAHAVAYYRSYRDRELAATRLEAKLSEARLDLLRMQLHPHFLFNTLHDISELMHEDVERADLMLTHVSDLLRLALDSSTAREVPLRRELDFLKRYLAIQQMRFPDRLRVSLDIHADVLDACVPYLILQPLVENAIRHGIARRPGAGRIQVRAQPTGIGTTVASAERLLLEVIDDGPGLRTGAAGSSGLGLANTRVRLRETYGDAHRFELAEEPGGGLRVALEIPLQYDKDSAAEAAAFNTPPGPSVDAANHTGMETLTVPRPGGPGDHLHRG